MTSPTLDSADDRDRFASVREADFDRRDAENIVGPVAGLAWLAMAGVAYLSPAHFGVGAGWAQVLIVVFGLVGLLLLAGSAGPRALAGKVKRAAPWFLFIVLAVEIWLIGPVKAPL